jgi:hypothetical protein
LSVAEYCFFRRASFAHDIEGFEVGHAGGGDSGFEASAAVEAPLGVAEELDELFFGFGQGDFGEGV